MQTSCPEACGKCCDCQQNILWKSTWGDVQYLEQMRNNGSVKVTFTATDGCGNSASAIGIFTVAFEETAVAAVTSDDSSGISDGMYLIGTICLGIASLGVVGLAVYIRKKKSGSHDFTHPQRPQLQLADDYIYDEFEVSTCTFTLMPTHTYMYRYKHAHHACNPGLTHSTSHTFMKLHCWCKHTIALLLNINRGAEQ